MTTSDFLLERLVAWGFYRIYGYPGDGINGIMGAFDRIGDKLQFIQVRHEEMAAFMACAHAKFTGETGICLATSGPGAVHLAQRPLRRKDGSHARGRHRRPSSDIRIRRLVPARSRSPSAAAGRDGIRLHGFKPGSDAPRRRPRRAHGKGHARGHVRDRAKRRARDGQRFPTRRTRTT